MLSNKHSPLEILQPISQLKCLSPAACCSPGRGDTLCCSHSSTRAPTSPAPHPEGSGQASLGCGHQQPPCCNVLLSLKVLQRKRDFSACVAISASAVCAVNLVASFRIFIFKEWINNNCFLPNEDKCHKRLELSCISCIWSQILLYLSAIYFHSINFILW